MLAPFVLLASLVHSSASPDSCDRRVTLIRQELDPATLAALPVLVVNANHFLQPSAQSIQICIDRLLPLAFAVFSPGLRLAPIDARFTFNSAYPRTVNDGLQWAGVGASVRARAGLEYRRGGFSIGLLPEFAWSANRDFDFPRSSQSGRSEFAHPDYTGIDWPKRLGAEPFSVIDPGQSYVRYDFGGAYWSVSHENVTLGAAKVYPMLLSTTAPGFWHFRAGTATPAIIGQFLVDAHGFWGGVSESRYFDGSGSNDSHLLVGSTISIEAVFLPGLRIGAAVIGHFTDKPRALAIGSNLRRTVDTWAGKSDVESNTMTALLASWSFPGAGFEVYAEWGREERPKDLGDLLREPDWSQGYVLGAGQFIQAGELRYRVWGELIHLGQSAASRAGRGFVSYYTHGGVTQGHTNRGQLLGAAIGPGSDGQLLGFDLWWRRGTFGASLERTRYDDDTYYARFARLFGEARHDVELTPGLHFGASLGALKITANAKRSRRRDRDFLALRAADSRPQSETNWSLEMDARWNVSQFLSRTSQR